MGVRIGEAIIIILGSLLRVLIKNIVCTETLISISYSSTDTWNSVLEGIALKEDGISPYEGDMVHQPPLALLAWSVIYKVLKEYTFLVFLLLDWYTCSVLLDLCQHVSRYLLGQQAKEVKSYHPRSISLILQGAELQKGRLMVIAWYCMNPYTLIASTAQLTTIVNNLLIYKILLHVTQGHAKTAAIYCALATYFSLHPIVFMVPIVTCVIKCHKSILESLVVFAGVLGGLLFTSFMIEGGLGFVDSVYTHLLTMPEYTPHLGLYWYLFAEMFDHFRVFFLWVFQIVIFAGGVAVGVRFKHDPVFALIGQWLCICVFRSYPSIAELGAILAVLPLWRHLFQYMRTTFFVACSLLAVLVLAPLMHYLWLYAGSANANFYFAVSLVHCVAQVFLLSDLLGAHLQREFRMRHGPEPTLSDGTKLVVLMDG